MKDGDGGARPRTKKDTDLEPADYGVLMLVPIIVSAGILMKGRGSLAFFAVKAFEQLKITLGNFIKDEVFAQIDR